MEMDFRLEDIVVPYEGEAALHQDLFWLLSVCLLCAIELKRGSIEREEAANFSGFYMSPDEAVRYINGYPAFLGESPNGVYAHIKAGEELIRRRLALTENCSSYRILRLREELQLSDTAFFAVLCAFACETDRGFGQMFAMLHGEKDLCGPTLGTVRSLLVAVRFPEGNDVSQLLPGCPMHGLLFKPPPNSSHFFAGFPLQLRGQVTAYLCGYSSVSPLLETHRSRLLQMENPPETLFLEEQKAALAHAARSAAEREACRITLLCGPKGAGKKECLMDAAAKTGMKFLLLRFGSLMEGRSPEDLLSELLPPLLLEGYALCFEGLGSVAGDFATPLQRLLHSLAPWRLSVFLLFDDLKTGISCEGYTVTRVDFPYPDQRQSLRFWEEFAKGGFMAEDVDFRALSSKYILTPGQIKTALDSAALQAEGQPVDGAALARAVLLNNATRLSELAEQVIPAYTWDDLVLDERPMILLKNVCDRLRYRYRVENEWGFGKKTAYGRGISVLLFGPPGTGKTMCAQVMAGELMLPLYRIDLSRIVSKYIGETAKNLDAIFAEAKASNVILFFDEADSLFSKRTDVKNSNDRHANSEISYLLQKIEDYAGISILATNLAQNFDEAFRRRISYMINIHMPNPAQRLALWRGSLPAAAPVEEGLDFTLLADNLELSGSVIKSAVTQAAYFAAEENEAIGMAHLVRAVRLELEKLGRSEPHFMQYYE
ncbi:MAG: ATP-binding protein [Oscillospiraceae bacterium]